jgi:hypothetical protein
VEEEEEAAGTDEEVATMLYRHFQNRLSLVLYRWTLT